MKYPVAKASQRGVGLIEILVAVLVLSIGVLGYAGLQLRALNSTSESHFQTQAAALAQDAVERIAANEAMRDTYYSDPGNWPQDEMSNAALAEWDQCYQNACTRDQVAAWDVLQLRWLAWNLLPAGRISTEVCTPAGVLCVTVAWGESTPADCDPSQDTCLVMEVLP